jgi:hypothetical protein
VGRGEGGEAEVRNTDHLCIQELITTFRAI